ncbi:MAG: glutamate 5-kinase [Acidobacteria bacterium RIFCSPLOWO2_02_FULL_60_20]|nr:MAG: glutamate 5-kinase [Acidobacteria bacterium RIFCSPLOWO2_02_FULL_60_20]
MQDERRLEAERERRLRTASKIVIKVGTATVTGPEGDLCVERVGPIVRSIADLMKSGRRVVLVSSGAVGLGRAWLELHPSRLGDLVTKQACAAVGQSLLMEAYKRLFSAWSIKVAQILLTEDDFTVWRRYSNLRQTIEKLLQFGAIPIINENDTVSTSELAPLGGVKRSTAFSDNDRLAALVMSGLEADALVLLTNVDGLYREPPVGSSKQAGGPQPQVISIVDEITPELRKLAAGPSASGRGGMLTKLEAAQIAMHCGGTAVIANGWTPDVLDRVFAGEPIGTTFLPLQRMRGKRRWIAFAAEVQGRIVVDAGAQQVITQGKASLLTSGVVRVESHFAPKDVVGIADRTGHEFARGIAECASHEVEQALGKKGAASRIVVRRDNIVLVRS